ncbi:MAG: ATP-dependent zinc protease [Thiohalospira sp.]
MPKRGWGAAVAVLAVGVSGCAAWERGPEPVTAEAFDERMAALEESLAEAAAERSEQRETVAGLQRLVEGLPSAMGAECRREPAEPSPVAPTCRSAEGDLPMDREVLGRREWVRFPSLGLALEARVDTGAKTSSLSATDITPFERDGEDWVRFRIALGEEHAFRPEERPDGESGEIERPVERTVTIVQATGEDERHVITLPMELGPISERVEFTLKDRTDLSTPLLLGRRFFMDIALVDVGRKHLHGGPPDLEEESGEDDGDEAAEGEDGAADDGGGS